MAHYSRAGLLKRGILLFWTLWISIVVLLNVADLLKSLGLLPENFGLASDNYQAIVHVTSKLGVPRILDLALFVGVIAWEAVCVVLFWWAARRFSSGHHRRWRAVYLAFTALLGLFGAFILSDEVFHAYKMEGDHRGIAILLLASLLALNQLPERVEAG
jgi:hypothetical protein